MALKPCLECGTPSDGARCPKHAAPIVAADNARRNAKTVAHGVKRAHFQRIRKQRLELTGFYCELRLPGCTMNATTAHLDEKLEGNHDAATIDDVKSACLHCHGVADGARAHKAAA